MPPTPARPPAPPGLYVMPRHRAFGSGDGDKLRRALDDVARHTLVVTVQSPDQLLLGEDGTVAGRYRFTATGLKQVLSLACRGAYQAVVDLAGAVGRPDRSGESVHSVHDAIDVYNRVIRRRYPRFDGKVRLIRNLKEATIEGVLGPRYVLFENGELLERAQAAVASSARAARFHSAVLSGRRLTVRYVHARPLFRASDGEDYAGGFHFANSELGGEAAVRAAVLVCRLRTDAFAMGRFFGGRIVHTGASFPDRMARMFAAATATEQDPARLRAAVERLRQARLGLERDTDERCDRIVAALRQHDVPKGLATAAVDSARFFGSSPTRDEAPRPLGHATLAGRSALDLYNALTDAGRRLYATSRDALEQAAYKLLVGQISL